jgi:hypothetical protein
VHFWVLETSDPEKHKEINSQLVGPLLSMEDKPEKREWTPSWWHGDEEASHSSILAAQSLTKNRKR